MVYKHRMNNNHFKVYYPPGPTQDYKGHYPPGPTQDYKGHYPPGPGLYNTGL